MASEDLKRIEDTDTEHNQVTRACHANPQRMLGQLFGPGRFAVRAKPTSVRRFHRNQPTLLH